MFLRNQAITFLAQVIVVTKNQHLLQIVELTKKTKNPNTLLCGPFIALFEANDCYANSSSMFNSWKYFCACTTCYNYTIIFIRTTCIMFVEEFV